MADSFLAEVTGVRPARRDPLDLTAPELGGHTLKHDAEFEALDGALCRIRDTVNLGIDALNQAGARPAQAARGQPRGAAGDAADR